MVDEKVEDVKKAENAITLQEVIDKTNSFIKGEITPEEMDEFGQTITMRAYLPLAEKRYLAIMILMKYKYTESKSLESKMSDLYKYMFFYGMLQTYAGIDCSNESLVTETNYDLLYPVFAPFILSFVENDYNQFEEYIKDCINLFNVDRFINALSAIDMDTIQQQTAENKNLLKSLERNKEFVTQLGNLAMMNDPSVASFVHGIQRQDNNVNISKIISAKEPQNITQTAAKTQKEKQIKNKKKASTSSVTKSSKKTDGKE